MSSQYIIPGSGFVQDDGSKQYVIPGVGFVNESGGGAVSDLSASATDKSKIQDIPSIQLDFLFDSNQDSSTIKDVLSVNLDPLLLSAKTDTVSIKDSASVQLDFIETLPVDSATISEAITIIAIGPPPVPTNVETATISDVATLNFSQIYAPPIIDSATISDVPIVAVGLSRQQVTQVLTEVESTDVGERWVSQVLTEVESVDVGSRIVTQLLAEVEWTIDFHLRSIDKATIADIPSVWIEGMPHADIAINKGDQVSIRDVASISLISPTSDADVSYSDSTTIKDRPTVFIYDFVGNQFISQVLTEVETDDVGIRRTSQVLSEVETDDWVIGGFPKS